MTRKERVKLRARMSELISDLIASGERLTTAQICDMIIDRFPHLVDDAKERLLRTSLTNMARDLLKEASKRPDEDEMRVTLFDNEMHDLKIQRCIAISSPDSEREMIWLGTLKATRTELISYVAHLRKSAAADVEKADRLAAFENMVGRIAPTDDMDTPIEDLLTGLQSRAV